MGRSLSRGELLKGATFGQYEVVELLGDGGTASVFEARHVALGKRMALKVLHDHLAKDAEVSTRFLREGRIASQLRHPNVGEVVDVGVEGGIPYLVMELLEGRDLRAHLESIGRLDLDAALAMLLPIASALQHAHDRGAIHRDVKPANVFLAKDTRGRIVPKLVDFGLSKLIAEDSSAPLTATNVVVGTVIYMAPEQTLGGNRTTARSDQYSFALMLYEAVTGERPFAFDSLYASLDAIRAGKLHPPSRVCKAVPRELDLILLRAMSIEPATRYPSMRELGRALLAFADSQTAAAWQPDFAGDKGEDRVLESPPRLHVALPSSARSQAAVPHRASSESSGLRQIASLPCAPGASPFHIKGLAYRGMVHMASNLLRGGMAGFLAELGDDALRTFISQPFLAANWYDVLPIVPLMATAARMLGQPLDAVSRTAGMGQARYDSRTVHRRIFDMSDLADFDQPVRRFASRYYDFGVYGAKLVAPGHLVLQPSGIPAYIVPWFSPMYGAYTAEIAALAGGKLAESKQRRLTKTGPQGGFDLVSLEIDITWR